MLAYVGVVLVPKKTGGGQPARPLHTARPSMPMRPFATACMNFTGVTAFSTQNRLLKSATPGQSALEVQRVEPAPLRLRICTGIAAPVPSAVVVTGVSAALALPVLVKSVLGSHPISIVRAAPGL